MSTASTAQHLEDYQLLHLVDRDAGNFELDQWSKHVLACDECSARLSRLGADSDAVTTAMAELQLPAGFRLPELPELAARRSRRWGSAAASTPWLRAAAVLLLVIAPFVAVEPLRAWAFDQLSSAFTALGLSDGDPAIDANESAVGGSATILFGDGATELTIAVANPQAAGELVITPGSDDEGALRVIGGGAETPLVTESGVRIDNSVASTASYDIRLPRSVRLLVVRVGDITVHTFTGPIDAPVAIDLVTPQP